MKRILGVDYGDVRVGLAISDELGITAQGLDTFVINGSIKKLRKFCDSLVQVMSEMQIMHMIGCGIGVALIEQDYEDAALILRNASIASEKAMNNNKNFNYCFVDAALLNQIRPKEKQLLIG